MNQLVQFEKLYRIKQGQLVLVEELPKAVSKIALLSQQPLVDQVMAVLALAKQCPAPLILKLSQKSSGLVWSVFAEGVNLEPFIALLQSSDFDYLCWPEGVVSAPKLMLFDMDSTFIQIEVIDELARRHGVGDEVARVTEAAMRGELDFAESLVSRVKCLQGLSETAIDAIASNLPLSPGVEQLVRSAKHHGCQSAIVSGGFMPFVERLSSQIPLYKVKANQLVIENGELSGEVAGKIVDADVKAAFLVELCAELGILPSQAMAIGDGANDLKMMHAAGFNLAYKAKPKVQQAANGRLNSEPLNRLMDLFDWPV